jgi:hypothetical protein
LISPILWFSVFGARRVNSEDVTCNQLCAKFKKARRIFECRVIPAPLKSHHTPRNCVEFKLAKPVVVFSVATPINSRGDTEALLYAKTYMGIGWQEPGGENDGVNRQNICLADGVASFQKSKVSENSIPLFEYPL